MALITAAIREGFHPAGARALAVAMAVVLVVVVFMAAAMVAVATVADIAKSQTRDQAFREFKKWRGILCCTGF